MKKGLVVDKQKLYKYLKNLYVIICISCIFTSCGNQSTKNYSLKPTTQNPSIIKDNTKNSIIDPVKNINSPGINNSISSNQKTLKDIIICIDPGHQSKGNTATEPIAPGSSNMKPKVSYGTVGVATKIPEYQLNLDVAILLQSELSSLGAKVVMTRSTNNVNISNIERANIANKAGAKLVIRIHADSSTNSNVHGVSMQIPGNKYIKDKNLLSNSRKAGQYILDSVIAKTGAHSKGMVVRNDLTGFNWSKVPTVLIEMGFMSNMAEDKKMSTPEYRRQIVNGITEGIVKYFKHTG